MNFKRHHSSEFNGIYAPAGFRVNSQQQFALKRETRAESGREDWDQSKHTSHPNDNIPNLPSESGELQQDLTFTRSSVFHHQV